MWDISNGGGCTCVGVGDTWKLSVPASQVCWEPGTAPKSKVYFFSSWAVDRNTVSIFMPRNCLQNSHLNNQHLWCDVSELEKANILPSRKYLMLNSFPSFYSLDVCVLTILKNQNMQ